MSKYHIVGNHMSRLLCLILCDILWDFRSYGGTWSIFRLNLHFTKTMVGLLANAKYVWCVISTIRILIIE